MNGNELRIGNIVHATIAGEINGPLVEYTIKSGIDIANARWFFEIPLTEEWLVRLGFKEHLLSMNCRWFELNGVKLYNDREYDDKEDYIRYDWVGVGKTVLMHIHHLQNLYYALTGEELTINQPK